MSVTVLWSTIISESKIAEVPTNLRKLLNLIVSKSNNLYKEIII